MSHQYSLDDPVDLIRVRAAWDQVLHLLELDLPKSAFEKFIRPISIRDVRGTRILATVPGQFAAEWIRSRFLSRIQDMMSDEVGEPMQFDLCPGAKPKEPLDLPSVAAVQMTPSVDTTGFRPNSKFDFESFVAGQSNRMAVAGAVAVAESPGEKYNPLFIHGASGLGKTHLMHAIANHVLKHNPRLVLRYLTAQQFVEQFVQAFQANKIDVFRRSHRNVDLWLVDDIQFVIGKDKTQEEVFHTFNHLYDLRKQIVFCSDRSPRDLYSMDERLKSRLESGLVVDIQLPDTETKAAILLRKAEQDKIGITPEIALLLAEKVHGNVRQLVGALTKLAVSASLQGGEMSFDLAEHVVQEYYSRAMSTKPHARQIVDAVGRRYNISSDDIVGDSRRAPIVHARHIAVFLTREITGDSWAHIGMQFGERDHTSMMHAFHKISEMISRDRDLEQVIRSMRNELWPDA